jgi:hypothetical protein
MIYAKELFSCILGMDDFGDEEDKEEDIGDEGDKQKNPLTKQEGIKKTGPLLCILMKE